MTKLLAEHDALVEQQAGDRVYRRGQTHAVEIVRLNMRDTADPPLERVKALRLENAKRFTDPLPDNWDGEMCGEIGGGIGGGI